jgi:hypothetical protein
MPGKHKARIGRQGRNKRGAQRKNDGALWHNPRNSSEHADFLRRAEYSCKICGGHERVLASTIAVIDNREVWICDKCADAWTPDTGAVKYWYEKHALYDEAG